MEKKVNKLLFKVFQFLKKLTKIKDVTPRPSHPKNNIKILLEINKKIIDNTNNNKTKVKKIKFLFELR